MPKKAGFDSGQVRFVCPSLRHCEHFRLPSFVDDEVDDAVGSSVECTCVSVCDVVTPQGNEFQRRTIRLK